MTSDCRPWPKGGTLAICEGCGMLQPLVNATWRSEADQIYRDYDISLLRDLADQAVPVDADQELSPRSTAVMDRAREKIAIGDQGRLLEVGCGNGALLRAFGRKHPGWTLYGAERDDSGDTAVTDIEGVEALYTCATEEIPGAFDLILSVHSLEHIPDPIGLLRTLVGKLTAGGHLVLQLPYFLQNPFYLFVADHCSHFTRSSLMEVVRRAGCEIVDATSSYLPKELTIIARKAESQSASRVDPLPIRAVEQMLGWMTSLSRSARDFARESDFGLWGSSVSATWLFTELGGRVDFFVDDDEGRQGKSHLGKPVLAPARVAAGSRVFLGLAPALADRIAARMQGSGLVLRKPEPLDFDLPETEIERQTP